MSTVLKPYPDYQALDAPWCPRVPIHWNSKRLGSVLKERGEVNRDYEEQNVLSVLRDIGVIPYADKGNIGNKKSEDIARYKIVRPNDIVLNSMNVIIGSVGRSRYQGCLSPVYYVLTPRNSELSPEFAESIFQVKPFQQSLVRIGYGILAHRMRIPMELLKSEVLPLPPPDEQAQIVRFIRHLDQRVNRLIKTKRRLIELLNEQKQAIIHRAVTRGLDPTVPLEPTGIDWLGDIPLNWQILPLKRLCTRITDGAHISPDRSSEDFAFVSTVDVSEGLIDFEGCLRTSTSCYEYLVRTGCKPRIGDVLFSKDGTVGKTAVVTSDIDFVVASSLVILSPKAERLDSGFLDLWLSAPGLRCQIESQMHGAGLRRISVDKVTLLPVAVPPLFEQQAIVEHVECSTRGLRLGIRKALSEIDFIREYRTRLVADLVTGQLDVRHLDLPEVEESLIEAIDAGDDDAAEETDEGVEAFE